MNLNKSITAVAIAAMLLSMSSFTSEAEPIRGTNHKKHNDLKVVKIHSKHHHSHDKFIGENRYETSAKILANYKNKDTLILVDASRDMSDGLSAAALSGKLNANIVPINPKNIDESSEKMIKKAKKVVLIGGYNAIPKEFEKSLSDKKVIRIAGKNRVETSKNIANYIGNYKNAYIVNGYTGQADAMSIAPVSARDVSPIILTKPNETNIDEKEDVKYTIIGGKDVVSDSIQQDTNSFRIGGANRYETNRMVLERFYKNRSSISFCNGETLVDALSGTYFARNHGIALVNSEENLHLLKNINTNQLGGLPLDIMFVVPSSNIIEKINNENSVVDTNKPEEKKDNSNEKDKDKDKNTSENENKNTNIEKNPSGEQILEEEQGSSDNQEPTVNKDSELEKGSEDNQQSGDNQSANDNEKDVKVSDMLIEGENFNKEIRTLKGFSDANKIVFNNEIPDNINEIEHLKLDKERNGSIVAYIKDNTIYVSSKDRIYANENSYEFMKDLKNIEEVDLSNLDTSKVVDMSSLFYGCSSLKSINVDNIDTSNVENMRSLFAYCKNLESIDLNKLNTSNVTDMSNMFLECQSLKELDLKNLDTSKVENMSYMFGDCYGLTELNLDNLDTSKVENMMTMFTNCKNLKEIDLEDIDTESVTDMNHMFSGCLSLEKLDLSNFNTSKVEDMSYMFAACDKLKNIDLENLDTSKVTDMTGMFSGCANINASINIENVVGKYYKIFEYCAVEKGAKLTLNYTNDKTKMIAKNMIKTKEDSSNIVLGKDLKSKNNDAQINNQLEKDNNQEDSTEVE